MKLTKLQMAEAKVATQIVIGWNRQAAEKYRRNAEFVFDSDPELASLYHKLAINYEEINCLLERTLQHKQREALTPTP